MTARFLCCAIGNARFGNGVESFRGAQMAVWLGRSRPTISSAVAGDLTLVWMLRAHGEGDPAAGGELRGHDGFARCARVYKIVKNAVGYRFVEGALVPIGSEIKFQGFAFDAELIGDVIDIDPGEIRLACDRTNRSEIVSFEMNPIIAAGRGVRKGLEPRLSRRGG